MATSARREQVGSAASLIPAKAGLRTLRELAAGCKACPLWKTGTQTVFGQGPSKAKVIFVGEQPGDKEDLAGSPFVGPAGRVLDEALEEVGIDRTQVYVTNVVKHFKWVPRGTKRIHAKPRTSEVNACRPWLDAEIDRIKPQVLVVLGATAAQALLGNSFRVSKQRGQWIDSSLAAKVIATVHPSSLLRIEDEVERHRERKRFVDDIKKIANLLK
ncbi:MAG TPA: UdgX family uracil-DNA binding protein [Terriglobales bacterium]|jgi:DNA polymerase